MDVRGAQPVYGARIEHKFAIAEDAADQVVRELAAKLPRDPMYPSAQPVSTTYIRSIEEGGPKGKIRVRQYPGSATAPTFLEFKEAADDLRTKARIPVEGRFVDRLLAGDDAREAVGLLGREGKDLPVAAKAVRLIDAGMEPAVRVDYMREAFEDAAGTVRVTVDRDLVQTGVGRLADAGSVPRPGAILEVKTAGDVPAWLDDLLTSHADDVTPLTKGKGATALAAVRRGVQLLR